MVLQLTFKQARDIVATCSPTIAYELALCAGTIVRANNHGNMDVVETLALEFLKCPMLPKFYSAQACAFLSTCDDYDRVEWIAHAAEDILEARHGIEKLEVTEEDLQAWTYLILQHKWEAIAEADLARFHESAKKGAADCSAHPGSAHIKSVSPTQPQAGDLNADSVGSSTTAASPASPAAAAAAPSVSSLAAPRVTYSVSGSTAPKLDTMRWTESGECVYGKHCISIESEEVVKALREQDEAERKARIKRVSAKSDKCASGDEKGA